MLWLATPILQPTFLHVLPADVRNIGDAQTGEETRLQKQTRCRTCGMMFLELSDFIDCPCAERLIGFVS